MRKSLIAFACAASAVLLAAPASAEVLVDDGITYNLTQTGLSNGGLTGTFTLAITGIDDGRSGVNAFAFTDAEVGDFISGSSAGFTFQEGGLNANGCNSSDANFICFDNTSFSTAFTDSLLLTFSLTSNTVGSFANWEPSFKIDWTGTANNYGLVSQEIPVNTGGCVGCTPDPQAAVPEPATWAMMLLGFGVVGGAMRRRRSSHLAQLA